MNEPRILCLDLTGEPGHTTFNKLIISSLADVADLLLVTPPGYLDDLDLPVKRATLPAGVVLQGPGRVLHRFNQIMRWRALQRILDGGEFTAVLILGYEPVTGSILAPRGVPVWSIEHNTIAQATYSRVKGFFYRRLPAGWKHFVFSDTIGDHLRREFRREGAILPHPLLERGTAPVPVPDGFPTEGRTYFAPSRSNSALDLTNLAIPEGCQLATKGLPVQTVPRLIVQRYFDGYEGWLAHSHAVFFSGDFEYRVSGVAYDALSHGTPVIMTPSSFARTMHRDYPQAVKIVESPEDMFQVSFDPDGVRADCRRLESKHSPLKWRELWAETLLAQTGVIP